MSFEQYTWEDRVSEHPNRRTLTYVEDSHTEVVDVAEAEGATYNVPEDDIAEYTAEVMNNIEARIKVAFDAVDADLADTLETFYPVGSVYISMDNTSPATLFGGTWVSISGGVLVASVSANATPQGNSNYFNYSPSGSIDFRGTVAGAYAELPYHRHGLYNNSSFIYSGSEEDFTRGNRSSFVHNITEDSIDVGGDPQQTHTHGFSGVGSLYNKSSHSIDMRMTNVTIYAWQRTG